MSLSQSWKFPYAAGTVLQGARERLAHHQGRLDWWEAKKAEVLDNIRKEGLEIDESLAAGFANTKSYNRDTTVLIRNDLQRDLSEAASKVREHRGLRDDYQHWITVLEGQNPSMTLELDFMDYLYFLAKFQAPAA